MSRLFDAEESPVLTPEAIAAVPPESWETARLKPVAALSVQALRYPVAAYLEAVRQGKPGPATRRKNHWAVVYRRQYALRWLNLSRPRLPAAACAGQRPAARRGIERRLERRPPAVGEVQLFSWFRAG